MNKSDTINELVSALSKLQSEITNPKKSSKGFNYDYADITECWDVIRPLMVKYGLALIQTNKPSKEGVFLETTLAHSSGQWLQGEIFMPVDKPNAQGYGSAQTYARRYALCSMLGIVADDDDDGAAASAIKKQTSGGSEKSKSHLPDLRKHSNAPAASSQSTIPLVAENFKRYGGGNDYVVPDGIGPMSGLRLGDVAIEFLRSYVPKVETYVKANATSKMGMKSAEMLKKIREVLTAYDG